MAHAGFPKGIKTDPEKLLNQIENPINQLLIISLKDDYRIGEMSYEEVRPNIFLIGIKICEINEQGKGYGGRAIKMLIEFIIHNLKGKKSF